MTVQSVLTAVAVVIAVAAFFQARRVSRRLERMVESYWELRYEYGQLRAEVERLQGGSAGAGRTAAVSGSTAFVPLSRLRSPDAVATAAEPGEGGPGTAVSLKRP